MHSVSFVADLFEPAVGFINKDSLRLLPERRQKISKNASAEIDLSIDTPVVTLRT